MIRGRAKRRRAAETTDALPDIPDAFDAAVAIDVEATPVAEPEVDEVEADEVELDEIEAHDADPRQPRPAPDRLGKTRADVRRGLRRHRSVAARPPRSTTTSWDELEETLLLADVGIDTTARLVDAVRRPAPPPTASATPTRCPTSSRDEIDRAAQATAADRSLHRAPGGPTVWLLVGVNGVGQDDDRREARDKREHRRRPHACSSPRPTRSAPRRPTSSRCGPTASAVDVVRGQDGGDPGAVVFDAVEAAGARDIDLVLVDTAGRLHTKVNLMDELEKLQAHRRAHARRAHRRCCSCSTRPRARTGSRRRASSAEAVGVTGVVLTKLDGTAEGRHRARDRGRARRAR